MKQRRLGLNPGLILAAIAGNFVLVRLGFSPVTSVIIVVAAGFIASLVVAFLNQRDSTRR